MKKKYYAIFMTMILCLSCLSTNLCFANESRPLSNALIWDINGDGEITLDDARAVLLIALGITKTTELPTNHQRFTLDDAHETLLWALGIQGAEKPDETTAPVESLVPNITKEPAQSDVPTITDQPTQKPQRTKHPAPTLEPWPTRDPNATQKPPESSISEEALQQIDFVEIYKEALECFNMECFNMEWYDYIYMIPDLNFVCTNETGKKELFDYLNSRLGKDSLVSINDMNELVAQGIIRRYETAPYWKFDNGPYYQTIFQMNVRQIEENKIIVDLSFTPEPFGAKGYDVTLEKQNDHWVVTKTEETWVS